MIILAWATVLVFIFWCFLAGLPDFIRKIDHSILEKHRKTLPEPEPDPRARPEKPKLKRVK